MLLLDSNFVTANKPNPYKGPRNSTASCFPKRLSSAGGKLFAIRTSPTKKATHPVTSPPCPNRTKRWPSSAASAKQAAPALTANRLTASIKISGCPVDAMITPHTTQKSPCCKISQMSSPKLIIRFRFTNKFNH